MRISTKLHDEVVWSLNEECIYTERSISRSTVRVEVVRNIARENGGGGGGRRRGKRTDVKTSDKARYIHKKRMQNPVMDEIRRDSSWPMVC